MAAPRPKSAFLFFAINQAFSYNISFGFSFILKNSSAMKIRITLLYDGNTVRGKTKETEIFLLLT
jgi:hypothetical protein